MITRAARRGDGAGAPGGPLQRQSPARGAPDAVPRSGAALDSYTAGFGSGSDNQTRAFRMSLHEKPTVSQTADHNTMTCANAGTIPDLGRQWELRCSTRVLAPDRLLTATAPASPCHGHTTTSSHARA